MNDENYLNKLRKDFDSLETAVESIKKSFKGIKDNIFYIKRKS